MKYYLAFMVGFVLGLSVHSDANAQSATSIIQQSSRVENSSPCYYASFGDWWRKIATCRYMGKDGRIYAYRTSAR